MIRTGSRSAFAKATFWSALARGAKPGNATTDVPRSANIVKAVRDLIIWVADLGWPPIPLRLETYHNNQNDT
jgi:hypothetical protein